MVKDTTKATWAAKVLTYANNEGYTNEATSYAAFKKAISRAVKLWNEQKMNCRYESGEY
jgi:hypothetical protein